MTETGKAVVVQVTCTEPTFPFVTVPLPAATVHCCVGPEGWVCTLTAYVAPLSTGVGNAKPPFAVMATVSDPFWRTSPDPARPLTVPPTENAEVLQLTWTLVTAPAPTVPFPPATVHAWVGALGWVCTCTR